MKMKLRKPVKRRKPCRKCICSVALLVGDVICPTDGRICCYVGKKAKDESIKVTAAEVAEAGQAYRRELEDLLDGRLLFEPEPEPKPKSFFDLSSAELLSMMESEPLLNPDASGLSLELLSKLSEKK